MTKENLVTIVKGMYQAFQRGDIPEVTGHLADDVEWYIPGPPTIPFAGPRHGLKEVKLFFDLLGQAMETSDFTPEEYYADGSNVVVIGNEQGRVRATGREYRNDWVMVFKFRGDKVISFRTYEDTAATERCFTP